MLISLTRMLGVLVVVLMVPAAFADGGKQHWIGSWATAPQLPGPFDGPFLVPSDQTIRQIVRVSHGGPALRIRVANTFGTAPLVINAASVGVSVGGAAVDAATLRKLTFGGEQSVQVAPGARVFSDPVRLQVAHLTELAISLHVPLDGADATSPTTGHVAAMQTNYVMSGNQVEQADPLYDATTTTYTYLTGVDVAVNRPTPVIAFVGDSITDGIGSTPDSNNRFPDLVAARIFGGEKPRRHGLQRAGILNLGISGNQVTASLIGPSVQARLDRDVLTQTGVSHVVVLIGINDIGLPAFASSIGIPSALVSAEQIISAHKQIITRAKARGLKVIGATLTPSGNFALPDYNNATGEEKRQAVNQWIRKSGAYDTVIDFDARLRDPADPTVMKLELSDDGLHPNDDGYRVMARTVPLYHFKARASGNRKRR